MEPLESRRGRVKLLWGVLKREDGSRSDAKGLLAVRLLELP